MERKRIKETKKKDRRNVLWKSEGKVHIMSSVLLIISVATIGLQKIESIENNSIYKFDRCFLPTCKTVYRGKQIIKIYFENRENKVKMYKK